MATLGIELSDVGFQAAVCSGEEPQILSLAQRQGMPEWPGFAYHDGKKFSFGRAAEDMWFVHPRSVTHTFWSKLAHDPAGIQLAGVAKPPSSSQLAFYFFQEFMRQVNGAAGNVDKVVLAVPGAYLKDAATEEEKIGLLLGLAGELKLPLAGVIDSACAALCDPRAGGFSPALPVVVVDIQLQGAELTLFTAEERLERQRFFQLPQFGFAQLMKHLNSSMGNRFLRYTAFDILEDGRIEQTFYRQTKEFLLSGAPEYRFQINTAKRNYELVTKHEKLAADSHAFVLGLVQAVQMFVRGTAMTAEPCTLALTDRAACLPDIADLLRAAGFGRLLHLPLGAAAAGAAKIGATRLKVSADIADVPVETSVPFGDARRAVGATWEARLIKSRNGTPRPAPTHAIFDGIGHTLGHNGHFSVGSTSACADLMLPESFNAANDCVVQLVREEGKLWFVEPTASRAPVDSGDRLAFRCGPLAAEVLFAHCAS
jgi:hypothetical protein